MILPAPPGYFLVSVFARRGEGPGYGPYCMASPIVAWRLEQGTENGIEVTAVVWGQQHIGAWNSAIELPDGRVANPEDHDYDSRGDYFTSMIDDAEDWYRDEHPASQTDSP